MKKIYVVHTSLVSHSELMDLFSEIIPEAKIFNIIDDSLLNDVIENNGINSRIIKRLCQYFEAASQNGADLIFNQCSSVGEASDIAAKLISVPVLKIDEAMAEKALEYGEKIAVVATVKSTMKPSCNLILDKADKAGKEVEVIEYLVDGALDVLMKENNRAKHNSLVLEMIKKAEKECDVIVLAQGSMTSLIPEIMNIKKPILTSPRLGVEKVRQILYE